MPHIHLILYCRRMHGDCRDHNMKVVFKVGGGSGSSSTAFNTHIGGSVTASAADRSWFHSPSTQPPVPAYNHIERSKSDFDNAVDEEMPFVALSDNAFGGFSSAAAADGRKRGENLIAASSRHAGGEWGKGGASETAGVASESLVKRLRERMAMEAALRNEAARGCRLAGIQALVLLILLVC
jgi:hypothetical protein